MINPKQDFTGHVAFSIGQVYSYDIYNIFIQVDNNINNTNLFRGGNHSSVVFANIYLDKDVPLGMQ